MKLPFGSWCLRLALVLTTVQSVFALSPSVSPKNPKLGQKVTLTYKINDPFSFSSKSPRVPDSIFADGITFTRNGMKEVQFGGYNYLRVTYVGYAGEARSILVPSKVFRVGARSITSEPLLINVGSESPVTDKQRPLPIADNPARASSAERSQPPLVQQTMVASVSSPSSRVPLPRSPSPRGSAASTSRGARAASLAAIDKGLMELPSSELFVGQSIPLILKFPLPIDGQYEGLTRPWFASEGFTFSGFVELPAGGLVTNGVSYKVITLSGSVTPYRAGTMQIPDVILKGRQFVLRGANPFSVGPYNLPQNEGWQDFELSAKGRELKVSELPEQDRPAHFTGAIGSFGIMPLEVSPKEAAEGQPVTLKVGLKGPGNLASVSTLRLVDADGWRVRGPKEEMSADGDVKTFEFTLFARSEQKNSPSASLVYFDPGQKKYLALEWPAVPLYAAGAGEGSGFEAVTQKQPSRPSVAATGPAPVGAVPGWSGFLGTAWDKVRPVAAGLLSLLVFTLLFFWAARFFLRRRREANEALKAALSKAWHQLEESGQNPAAFYAAAAGVISSRLALWRGKTWAFDDTGEQLNRSVSNLPLREELTAILARRDELNYGAEESSPLRPGEHAAVCATLEKFCEDVT